MKVAATQAGEYCVFDESARAIIDLVVVRLDGRPSWFVQTEAASGYRAAFAIQRDLPGPADSPGLREPHEAHKLHHEGRHPRYARDPQSRLSAGGHGARPITRQAAGRAVLLELRVSRPLHTVGYGVCRPAAVVHGARPPFLGRGP